MSILVYICQTNQTHTDMTNSRKETLIYQLKMANQGLGNMHSFLEQAIAKNDSSMEQHYFNRIWEFSILVDKLEKQLTK